MTADTHAPIARIGQRAPAIPVLTVEDPGPAAPLARAPVAGRSGGAGRPEEARR
ncbi:MAG: hypothetical protein IT545_14505 [Rhodobacteraceae bacterium]|nr:hypothetical protein [Paracoccaceae bacterium]